METVLLDIFFSRSRKIQTAKTQEDEKGKVWSWYKTTGRDKHLCLEKALFDYLYRLFGISKNLVSSESKSMANILQ